MLRQQQETKGWNEQKSKRKKSVKEKRRKKRMLTCQKKRATFAIQGSPCVNFHGQESSLLSMGFPCFER